ncbi:MAG: sialidase family protein [Candidatus Latescibacterota bacterium]|jgi:sialidase-1
MLEQSDLFTSGSEGYHTFRIPALIATPAGTLLAFCEGRRSAGSDSGDIDLLLRRSIDGGQTWSDIQTVWAEPGNTCGNPCPVVDRETGIISLLMTHNLGTDVERQIIDGSSSGTRTVWLARSSDDGQTWSQPREITAATKASNWTWYATGPGAGIQLKSGRLVVPCDHIEIATNKYYSHVILSDNGGETWRLGGITPTDQVNECEVAELEDGRLLLNMRNYDPAQRARAYAHSSDGGESWSSLKRHPDLIEPICQASLRRLDGPNGTYLLFTNPASNSARENMTVRLSSDSGLSWPISRVLYPGPAAYSCLATLPDGRIACLYELGEQRPYERLQLAFFDLDWLGAM